MLHKVNSHLHSYILLQSCQQSAKISIAHAFPPRRIIIVILFKPYHGENITVTSSRTLKCWSPAAALYQGWKIHRPALLLSFGNSVNRK